MIPDASYTALRIAPDRDGVPSVRLRPGEKADFSRDWTHHLADGEIILASGWTLDGAAAAPHGKTVSVATVWLDEAAIDLGEGMDFAVLVNSIETSTGRKDSWTMRVYPPDA